MKADETATGSLNYAGPLQFSGHAQSKRERRADLRCQVDTTATIIFVRSGSKLPGQLLDLSISGCRIRTDERFPVGFYTRVETEFCLKGLPFRLGGVIQTIHDPHNVGVRFLDVSERKQDQVRQLILEIDESKIQSSTEEEGNPGVQG
jgi:c-di-GMP-binding flagellar brake protein YcgR